MSAVPAIAAIPQRISLVDKFASKYSIESDKLLTTLKATAFKQRGDGQITNEQMAALLIVADQYGLNPFTKEIFAFPDKNNGIVPVVGVDGWSRIINENKQLDGIEFRYSETTKKHKGKTVHDWIECVIRRKDRAQPVVVREFFDEVVRELNYTTPWDTHPNRMHRHKTLIQCSRIAFGFAGIYDEDEAERIIDMGAAQVVQEKPAVAMPQSKSAAATIDNETGEIINKESAPAAPGTPSPANTTGGGADAVKPLSPSQARLIQAKLKGAALTILDLEAQYPTKCIEPKEGRELFGMGEVNGLLAWIAERAQG